MKKTDILDKKRGFTLIEMVVSIAVFLLISGAAVGIFLSIISRQKEVLSEQELLNQISYAEEYMSRALRMAKVSTSNTDSGCLDLGDIYVLTRPDENSFYNGIKFLNQTDGEYVDGERNAMCEEIFLDNVTDPARPVLMIQKGQDPAIALTSSDMEIKYIRFGVNGLTGSLADCPNSSESECFAATSQDEVQPRVTTLLKVELAERSRIFQTTISQRNLNVNLTPQ